MLPSVILLTCTRLALKSDLYTQRLSPLMPLTWHWVQGQAYTDAGATAYDVVDGALNNIITTGLSSVNTMVVRLCSGTY